MCRNIQPLFNLDPPVTEEEIQMAARQFVRKVSGMNAPSRANQAAFQAAIDTITEATGMLLNTLETHAPPRDRATREAQARARAARRFPTPS